MHSVIVNKAYIAFTPCSFGNNCNYPIACCPLYTNIMFSLWIIYSRFKKSKKTAEIKENGLLLRCCIIAVVFKRTLFSVSKELNAGLGL